MFVGSGASALTSPCPSPPAGRPRHSLAAATPQDYAPVLQLQMVYKGCWVVQVAVAMARGAVPHDFGPCFGLGVMAFFVLCDGLLFGRGAVRASGGGALHRELLLSS